MPSQDPSTQAPAAASFGRACADLARQHPLKVMAIVGSAFFCAGLAASLSLGTATPPSVAKPAVTAAPATPSIPVPAPSKETTAAATDSNAPNCEKQTWPYLDRPCLDALAAKSKQNPQVRVVSTDREAPSAVEGGAPVQAPLQAKAAAPPRQEPADAALTPIIPVAPVAPVVAKAETAAPAPAAPQAKPAPVAQVAVAAKEEPRPAPRSTDAIASTEAKVTEAKPTEPKSPEVKPKSVASVDTVASIPAANASETANPDPAADASGKAKKKERAQRANPSSKSGGTMLVRDTYTYPDGRQVSVTRRVKKDDRFRAEPEDDEETPARGRAAVAIVPLNTSD